MPENEFEKEVQQKMAGFKLRPNDAIWKTVSAKIVQQKGRSRKVILTIVLLCCFLMTTLIISDVQQKYSAGNKTAANVMLSNKEINDASIKSNNLPSGEINTEALKNDIGRKGDRVREQTSNEHFNKVQEQVGEQEILSGLTKPVNQHHVIQHKRTQYAAGKKSVNTHDGTADEIATHSFSIAENSQTELQKHNRNEASNPISAGNKMTDTNIVQVNRKVAYLEIKPDTLAIAVKKIESKRKNKWNIGIIFMAGHSSTASGYLASAANSSYADYLTNLSSSPGTSYNSSVQFDRLISSPYSPTKIKPGTGFTLGISASKKLSAKSNFMSGINYKIFTTNKAIGGDSSLNGMVRYGIGNANTYHNKFHFIEIPLAVQIQIACIKKRPLLLEGGITFSQLINVNALQFDVNQNKYYIDNKLLNKTIIGFTAGLSVNLANKNMPALLLGPQFYYSATPVAGSGLYTKTHYSFVGIKLQKMLKRN